MSHPPPVRCPECGTLIPVEQATDPTLAGPALTSRHRQTGIVVLHLLNDRSWVHRRVDKLSYADPVTIRRTHSIDLELPSELFPRGDDAEPHESWIPLAMLNKWRLTNVDLRDESGRSIPLGGRVDHGPIGAAALVALGHVAMGRSLDPGGRSVMPPPVELACRQIAHSRLEVALNVCEELPRAKQGECACSLRWRERLSTDASFMGLAWELARGFPLLVRLQGTAGSRRVVKFSCDTSRYRRRSRLLLTFWPFPWHLRPVWRRGRIEIQSIRLDPTGARLDSTRTRPAVFCLAHESGEQIVQGKPDGVRIDNLSPGRWTVSALPRPGYEAREPTTACVVVEPGALAKVRFVSHREAAAKPGPATGRMLLRTVRRSDDTATTTEPTADEVITFTVEGPHGVQISKQVRYGGEVLLADLLPGAWRVRQTPERRRSYTVKDTETRHVIVEPGETTEVLFANEHLRQDLDRALPVDLARASYWRRVMEGAGARSLRILVSGRIGDGGSYHLEFEAPPGFKITRATLSDTLRVSGSLDVTIPHTHRCHLYVPDRERPRRMLALVNIRPRLDTIVATSLTVSIVTMGVLVAVAFLISEVEDPARLNTAVGALIASPGALSAFAARPPDNPVISRLTAGLRFAALVPGLLAFTAALTVIALASMRSPPTDLIQIILDVCACLSGVVVVYWLGIVFLTMRPPESQHGFRSPGQKVPEKRPDVPLDVDPLGEAFALRADLRLGTRSIPNELRSEFFTPRGHASPALFVDSSNPAPTFMGLDELEGARVADAARDAALQLRTVRAVDGGIGS